MTTPISCFYDSNVCQYLTSDSTKVVLCPEFLTDTYLLSSGGTVSGPIIDKSSTCTGNQLVSRNLVTFPQTDLLLVKAESTVSGNISLYNSPLSDAFPAPKKYLHDCTANFLPLSGHSVAVIAANLINSRIVGGTNISFGQLFPLSSNSCVYKDYVDNSIVTLTASLQTVAGKYVPVSGGTTKNVCLTPLWPADDNELVSALFVREYIDCMFRFLQDTGIILLTQTVMQSVYPDSFLDLEFCLSQGTGGGTCSGTEYPLTLVIEYQDIGGSKVYSHNFYSNPWGTLVAPQTMAGTGWYKYSIALSDISGTINFLSKVSLKASGSDFRTLVDRFNVTVCSSGANIGQIVLEQIINGVNISSNDKIVLSFDVLISEQSNSIPFSIAVQYTDASGTSKQFVREYVTEGVTIGNVVLIPFNTWTHQDIDLTTICPCLVTVTKVSVVGVGSIYNVSLDNLALRITTASPLTTTVPPNILSVGTGSNGSTDSAGSAVTLSKKTSQPNVTIPSGSTVVLSADVNIASQSSDSSKIPVSISVNYTDATGTARQHTVNVSTLSPDPNVLLQTALNNLSGQSS